MTANVQSTMIYIGRFADIDTDENNFTAENPGSLLGAYSDLSLVQVTERDRGNDDDGPDGGIMDNEANADNDRMIYDTGTGVQNVQSDTSAIYNAVITEGDGTTRSIQVLVVQTTSGDVFVTDLNNSGNLDNINIRSIELTSVGSTNAQGHFTGQSVDNAQIVCFTPGTSIVTEAGPRPIEDLKVGDRVQTVDHGLQPIRWIDRTFLRRPGRHAPVRIAAGALGANQPSQDLVVSPQHRVMIRSDRADRMIGTAEILIAAKRLVGCPGITVMPADDPVRYIHILLDRHELVIASGTLAETLFAGAATCARVPPGIWFGIERRHGVHGKLARTVPTPRAQTRIVRHHLRQGTPLAAPVPIAA